MKFRGLFIASKRPLSLILVLSFILDVAGVTLVNILLLNPLVAEAAQVVIEGSPNTTGATHTITGSATVFISDQVGYKFFVAGSAPDTGMCVYRKTTDGGATWGSRVRVDSQNDCINISVWYDQWTPGDTGNYIHISTIDTSADELYYNRLDTSNDTLLLATAVSAALGALGVYAVGTNENSIAKATDGKIYMVADDGDGTNIRSCSASCDLSASWTAVGTPPQGNANSFSILVPLSSGSMMLINRSTTNILRSSTWAGISWTGFTNIDAAAVQNVTYDAGFAVTLDTDNNDIYLAYVADNNDFITADHDIRTRLYSGGSWSSKTDVLTNVAGRGLLQVAISRNQNNGDIYVGYTARSSIATTTTANVYWVQSTDDMTSWGAQQGPMDTTSADMYGIDMNIMATERIFVSWYDVTATDIIGDTVADIGPEIELSTIGNQTLQVRDGINNVYTGGSLVLKSRSSQTVSSIIITEGGSIQAQNNLKNIKLYYDLDTSNPYNCSSESYSGSETQFGSTVAGGFSGANGTASFSASPVTISPTQTMCIYTVLDVQTAASNGNTIEISVANPSTDISVSGGFLVKPATEIALASTTTVIDPNLTQFGYHWRLDNGTQITASSATNGINNSPLTALQIGTPKRLRIGVANQGSTSTNPTTFRLEYGTPAPTCADTSSWQVVGNSGAVWNLYDSSNLTNGADTTDITPASGGVTNLFGTSFISSNGGVRDTSSSTGSLNLDINNFVEVEYSLVASTTAVEGQNYCFRMTQAGTPLSVYDYYPNVTISADVTVGSIGTQIASTSVQATNVYAGGGFSVIENSGSRNVTNITLTELGTVDGALGIKNLKLLYELDTSSPYNCSSESYSGSEAQFGATSTTGFSGLSETASFSDSVGISTTAALCLYPVYDVSVTAQNAQTIDIAITSPSTQVVVSGSPTVGPSGVINISGVTSIQGAILTQSHYHWRNDNGNETGATSATLGTEDTPKTDFLLNSSIRLRLGVTNTGSVTSVPKRFRLEYAPKITTCDAATVWTDVDSASDGWDMRNSSFITNGETTTNIAVGSGGVTNGAGLFIGTNGGVRDTESMSATTTIPSNDYLDVEFSITSTNFTSYGTTYCFRVSAEGIAFGSYDKYAEIQTAPKRDFKIQRGSVQVSGTSTTVLAGVGYTAPASTSLAFVSITNSHYTGAGNTASTSGQNADDVTAYISNPSNIATSFTIARPPAATSNTYVDWEIIEFIGNTGTDNEMIVRGVGTVSYTTATLVATGTTLSNIANNNKVVVFVTGASNRNTSRNFYASQVTSEWNTATQAPVFKRGANGASIADVSYAVVEFVGVNWNIQRVEHLYTVAGTPETKPITAVNSLARTFIHAQKRMGATTNVVNFGHDVHLSSIGFVSFLLESGATVAVEQTSVAWIIENTQTSSGAMKVQRPSGTTNGGTGPLALSVTMITPVEATNNTSISANSRAAGANTTYPRPMAGFTITSTSTYQVWRSNTGSLLTYRVEIIEWPVANLAIRQNYYRFYVDNNNLKPTDPWPPGGVHLGENTTITAADEPLGVGDHLRVRMSIQTTNANMPAGFVNFKLQFALRASTCSAIDAGSWSDVGAAGSGSIWRGYNATGTTDGTTLSTNPPTGGDLLILISDVAGSLVHENPSAVNPYPVIDGENFEYDWYLEQNGAIPKNTYCFRAVKSDGTPLDGYNNYPQIRTASFTPIIKNWRWYSDIENETPISPLANENVSPIEIANNDTITLRVSVDERRNAQGDNVKFKLQYSEDITFANSFDVVATSSCQQNSLWCYTEGVALDNQLINNAVLSDNDGCVSGVGIGCGRHNTIPNSSSTHTHLAGVTQEYSFAIKHAGARVNAVYYFRLFDVTSGTPTSLIDSYTYPSLLTEGPLLQFTLSGLPAGTSTAGVVTNVSTTPTGVGFGTLALNTEYVGAHRISVNTNATEGYQLFSFARQQLLSSNGASIPTLNSTNLSPSSWISACNASSTGCFGYHATDPTLKDGSTRFAPSDTYAGIETSPREIMYSSIPSVDTHDIVYRIKVNQLQPAGDYETEIVYLAVPSY